MVMLIDNKFPSSNPEHRLERKFAGYEQAPCYEIFDLILLFISLLLLSIFRFYYHCIKVRFQRIITFSGAVCFFIATFFDSVSVAGRT